MAVDVVISPKGLFKKKVELKDIVGDDIGFGIMDEYYRLVPGEQGKYTVLYNKQHLARGAEVSFENGGICFRMPLPNSLQDITWFYRVLIPRTCRLLGTKAFRRDEEDENIEDTAGIERMIAADVQASEGALRHMAQSLSEQKYASLMIFGVKNPISLGEKELAAIDNDMEKLGLLLNEKQQIDAFYPGPKLYRNQERVFGVFMIGAGIPSIVPQKPSVPFSNNDIQVDDWYAYLALPNNEAKPVVYEDFIKNVPNAAYYDAAHVLVTLSEDEVKDFWERYGTNI